MLAEATYRTLMAQYLNTLKLLGEIKNERRDSAIAIHLNATKILTLFKQGVAVMITLERIPSGKNLRACTIQFSINEWMDFGAVELNSSITAELLRLSGGLGDATRWGDTILMYRFININNCAPIFTGEWCLSRKYVDKEITDITSGIYRQDRLIHKPSCEEIKNTAIAYLALRHICKDQPSGGCQTAFHPNHALHTGSWPAGLDIETVECVITNLDTVHVMSLYLAMLEEMQLPFATHKVCDTCI